MDLAAEAGVEIEGLEEGGGELVGFVRHFFGCVGDAVCAVVSAAVSNEGVYCILCTVCCGRMCLLIWFMKGVDGGVYIASKGREIEKRRRKIIGGVGRRAGPKGLARL